GSLGVPGAAGRAAAVAGRHRSDPASRSRSAHPLLLRCPASDGETPRDSPRRRGGFRTLPPVRRERALRGRRRAPGSPVHRRLPLLRPRRFLRGCGRSLCRGSRTTGSGTVIVWDDSGWEGGPARWPACRRCAAHERNTRVTHRTDPSCPAGHEHRGPGGRADRSAWIVSAAVLRLGACTWIYEAPLEETLTRIAAAGCDGVELLGEPEMWTPDAVRRLLARTGLAPLALTASCKVPQTRRDLAHPDPSIRAEAVAYLVGCLRFAAAIGAPLVQMLPSGESRLAPISSREQEWRWSVEGMQTAGREAERLGVRIAIEPLNRYEAYLVTTTAQALAYLRDVGSPQVGMTLDLFHANIEEPDIPAAIRAAGSRLWHVHVADSNRRGLGGGHLDLFPITVALREVGYSGAMVLEIAPPEATLPGGSPQVPWGAVLDRYVRESVAALRIVLGPQAAG
ncbi:MAG: sugar phosphate isomerase/epimerase, partial [Bacillati bacterium ANGP1]